MNEFSRQANYVNVCFYPTCWWSAQRFFFLFFKTSRIWWIHFLYSSCEYTVWQSILSETHRSPYLILQSSLIFSIHNHQFPGENRAEYSLDLYKQQICPRLCPLIWSFLPVSCLLSVCLYDILFGCQLPWQTICTKIISSSVTNLSSWLAWVHKQCSVGITFSALWPFLADRFNKVWSKKKKTEVRKKKKGGGGGNQQQLKDNYLLEKGQNFYQVCVAVRQEKRESWWIPCSVNAKSLLWPATFLSLSHQNVSELCWLTVQ